MRIVIDLVDDESQLTVKSLSEAWESSVVEAIEDELDNRGVPIPEGADFAGEAVMMLSAYHRALTMLVDKVIVIDVGFSSAVSVHADDFTQRINDLLSACDVDGGFPMAFRMTVGEHDFDTREFFEIGRCRKLARHLERLLHSFILSSYRKATTRAKQLTINFNW